MALQGAVYRPRDAEHTVLHQVIAEHLEAFLRAVAEAGDEAGPPRRCGIGSWGVRCLISGDYVIELGATDGAPAAGGG